MTYIWTLPDWPSFRWDTGALLSPLADARHRQGRLLGRMERLGFALRDEARLVALTEEVVQSSGIEGERLDRGQVRSSLARRLGLPTAGLPEAERRVEGIVEVQLDATADCDAPLTAERLCRWQAALFPTGQSGLRRLRTGAWRDDAQGPMQVVSGPHGREVVHFEAPPAARLAAEMARFIDWFEAGGDPDGVLRAGLAHLWLVTIHPFEDGNGRIARAVADMGLARLEGGAPRFYSVSAEIRRRRGEYYRILEDTQKGDLDVTPWLLWFVRAFVAAVTNAETLCDGVLRRAHVWTRVERDGASARQRAVLWRVMEDGFEGKLTARKWATLAKCSVDTAQRDINDLVERGLLARNPGGGRSTSYAVVAT